MSTDTSRSTTQLLRDAQNFSLALGGPLFQLLRRAHLSDDALLMPRRRVIVISLFAWLPLLVGGYQVTTTAAPDVLILRPAIINVRVTAPDLMTAGMDTNVITSAGSGTFYLDLWAPPHTPLARAMDAEADQQPFAQQANSVTNMAAADTILTKWADDLVSHLDAVRGKPTSK